MAAKSYDTLMAVNVQLSNTDGSIFLNQKLYGSVLGKLQYMCYTRLDIAFAVNRLSQYMHKPHEPHWVCIKRVLRYLVGTSDFGLLIIPLTRMQVQSFADADWPPTRRIGSLSAAIAPTLAQTQSLGFPRNSRWSLDLLLRLNIEV